MIARITGFLDKLELDKQKIFLLILACLLVIFIDFSFIMKAQLGGLKNAGEKIVKLRKDIDSLNKDLAMMRKPEAGQEGAVKNQRIILEGELPLLLEEISKTANKHKVRIMQIKPARGPKAKEEVIGEKRLIPVTINLDLYCGYHSLGSFINALENGGAFIAVQALKITRSSDDYSAQNVDLELKTYVKK